MAWPLKFDIFNICKPSCTQCSEHCILSCGNITPMSFHMLAYLASKENYCTNAWHKTLVFCKWYNRNQQYSWLKGSSKGINKTSRFRRNFKFYEHNFVTSGWVFPTGKNKLEASEWYWLDFSTVICPCWTSIWNSMFLYIIARWIVLFEYRSNIYGKMPLCCQGCIGEKQINCLSYCSTCTWSWDGWSLVWTQTQ